MGQRGIHAHTEAIRAELLGRSYSEVAAMPEPPVGNLPHGESISGRKADG